MSLPKFDYHAPDTVEEALALLSRYGEDAVIVAGGLTVITLLRERLSRPRALISLSGIPELGRIRINGDAVIGAAVTHSQVIRSADLAGFARLVCDACGRVGSPAIRNMGTLGGSISQGDGASDVAPALLALGADVRVTGAAGSRTVALENFFFGVFSTALEQGEILTEIHIPSPAPGTRTRFKKYTCTSVEAFAAVTVAAAVQMETGGRCIDARIGLGSVAPMPLRAAEAENLLRGSQLTTDVIARAAEAAAEATDPPSDGQGSTKYRREMTRVWVRRLLEDVAQGDRDAVNAASAGR